MFERPAEQSNNEDTEGETQGTEWPTHDWQNPGWPWDPRNQSIGVQIGRNKWPYGLQKVCTCHIRSHRNSQTVSNNCSLGTTQTQCWNYWQNLPGAPDEKRHRRWQHTSAHTHRVLTTEAQGSVISDESTDKRLGDREITQRKTLIKYTEEDCTGNMPQQRVFTFAYLSVRSSSTPLRWLSSVTSIFSWQRANGHVQSRREPEGTVVILHKPSRLCIPVGNPYHTYSKLNPQAGARFRKKKSAKIDTD